MDCVEYILGYRVTIDIYIYTVNLDKSMLSMLFVTNVLLVKQIYSCF